MNISPIVRFPRTAVVWLCKSTTILEQVKQGIASFVTDSVRTGLVPNADEHDIKIISGLAGVTQQLSQISPEDVILPRGALVSVALDSSIPSFLRSELFNFTQFMLEHGVGAEEDPQILESCFNFKDDSSGEKSIAF